MGVVLGRVDKWTLSAAKWLALKQAFKGILANTVIVAFLFFWHPFQVFPEAWFDGDIAVVTQFFYHSKADGNLAVVLIDSHTLDTLHNDWPLTYEDLAGITHQIACAGAIGIFFDIVPAAQYNLAATSNILLAQTLTGKQAGTHCGSASVLDVPPIYFGKAPGINSGTIDEFDRRGQLFLVETDAGTNLYPVGATAFPSSPPDDANVTPAFGLLRRYCGFSTHPNIAPSWCPQNAAAAAYGVNPIFLKWGGRINGLQPIISDSSGCADAGGNWLQELQNGVRQLWAPGDRRCPPLLTLSGQDLYRDAAYQKTHGVNPLDLLRGRIVFVGVNLPALNDRVISPVQGQLPGVYFHAVALDNLITYGADYPREPSSEQKTAFVVFFIFVTQALKVVLFDNHTKLFVKTPPKYLFWGLLLLFVSFSGLTIIFFFFWPISLYLSLLVYVFGSDYAIEQMKIIREAKQRKTSHVKAGT